MVVDVVQLDDIGMYGFYCTHQFSCCHARSQSFVVKKTVLSIMPKHRGFVAYFDNSQTRWISHSAISNITIPTSCQSLLPYLLGNFTSTAPVRSYIDLKKGGHVYTLVFLFLMGTKVLL